MTRAKNTYCNDHQQYTYLASGHSHLPCAACSQQPVKHSQVLQSLAPSSKGRRIQVWGEFTLSVQRAEVPLPSGPTGRSMVAGSGRARNAHLNIPEPRRGDRKHSMIAGVLSPLQGSVFKRARFRALPDPATILTGLRPSTGNQLYEQTKPRPRPCG